MMYGIKINNRTIPTFIEWCDKCWYETVNTQVCIFSYEQAKQIVEWLKQHYVYDVTIIGSDGSTEVCCCLKNHKPVIVITDNEEDDDEDFWSF